VLTGRLHRLVAPLIDGTRSVDDIVELARDKVPPIHVYHVLANLEAKGYLTESDDCLTEGEAALWSVQNITAPTAAARLANTLVSVSAFGDVTTEPFRTALQVLRVRVGEPGHLGVVLTDDYLRIGLEEYNRQALASGRPWLLVKPVGCQLFVGPLFLPGKTGCWECLAERLRINRQVERYVHEQKGRVEPFCVARSYTPATLQIAWNLAAGEIAAWIVRGESPLLEGKVQTLDLLSWKTLTHMLVRLPQCSTCGNSERYRNQPVQPIVLQSRKVITDAGHRVVRPETTLERYGHHVSPITGAVHSLERCGPTNDGVTHVYVTGPNYSRRAECLAHLRSDLSRQNSGKGMNSPR
jgi:oxazoline/thiazoline synthase